MEARNIISMNSRLRALGKELAMSEEQQDTGHRRSTDVTAFEKHGQTIIVSCIFAMLTWLVYTVNETSKQNIEQRGDLALANQKIDTLQDKITDLVSDSPRMYHIEQLRAEIRALETRITRVEADVRESTSARNPSSD